MKRITTMIVATVLLCMVASFTAVLNTDVKVTPEKRQGIYIIYPGQTPNFEYDFVQSIKLKGLSPSYYNKYNIEGLFKIITKDEIKCDAIIFTDDEYYSADCVKIK